jgi:DNA primase
MNTHPRPPIEGEIARRGIQLRGRGPERWGPCPVCGGTDRFSINLKKQLWNCRGCGLGGDVIDLVQHIDQCDYRAACETLRLDDRPTSSSPPPPVSRQNNDNSANAGRIWRAAVPIAGTPAEDYLRSRRLEYADPDGDVLRFHPRCSYGPGVFHPCMVALFRASPLR